MPVEASPQHLLFLVILFPGPPPQWHARGGGTSMTGKVLLLHFFLPLIQHADGKRTDLCFTVLRFLRCVRGDASEGRISGCFGNTFTPLRRHRIPRK